MPATPAGSPDPLILDTLTLPASPQPVYEIYCDESSQTKHRYLVIGASVCLAGASAKATTVLDAALARHGGTSELKWEKVKRRNRPMYEEVVDTYFDMLNNNLVHYYALVVDTSLINSRTYAWGDRELGFNKLLFALLQDLARVYKPESGFHVQLDDRTTQHSPDRLKDMLNDWIRREWRISGGPFRTMRFVESHESRLIQVTDVITGAIAYAANAHWSAVGAAEHKKKMMEHIAACARVPSLGVPTPPGRRGFDIWHLALRQGRAVPRA